MTFDEFMEVLGINEEYQIKDRVMQILLSEEKNTFFEKLIERGFDTSKDEIRYIFETELADRKSLKQDYTPESICKLIHRLAGDQAKILDICCGVGSLSIPNIKAGTSITMEEISDVSISLALLNMAIRDARATIIKKDVLKKEVYECYEIEPTGRYGSVSKKVNDDIDDKYDCIISNPPYSLKWEPANDERYWAYGIAPKSKADYAFILDALHSLSDNGTAYIILPHGVLFRGKEEAKIRKAMCYDGVIEAIISLPENMFTNTGIPTIIMCLKKGRRNRDIMFIDSSKNFDKVGKYNVMNDDQINQIVETYRTKQDKPKYSKLVKYDEIEYNDFNLNIPRYVETFDEPEKIEFHELLDEMHEIENSIHEESMQIAEMLKDITGPAYYIQQRDRLIEQIKSAYIHDVSDAIGIINNFISSDERMCKYKLVKLLDVVQIERSKKGKIYPKGSTIIQLSATKGQVEYLEEAQTVAPKYGVMIPIGKNVNPKYLYRVIVMTMPNFLAVYQTGLNIVPDVFKHMSIFIHEDISLQNEITELFDRLDEIEKKMDQDIQSWKNVKTYHLDEMFPSGK